MLDLRSKRFQVRFLLIIVIHYAFKIIGLAPFSLQTKSSVIKSQGFPRKILVYSKIGLVYNFLFAIVQCSASAFAMFRWYQTFAQHKISSPKYLVYTVVLLVNGVASVNAVIRWAITQKSTIRIMNRILEVDGLLRELKNTANNRKVATWLAINVIIAACMTCNLIITFMFEEPLYCESIFISVISAFLAPTLCYSFIVQYVLILGLISSDFERVNENLSSFKEFEDYSSLRPFFANYSAVSNSRLNQSCDKLAALKLLRAIRTGLSELTQDIADWFSFPVLLVMTFHLLSVLDLSYTLLVDLTSRSTKTQGLRLHFYIGWYIFLVQPLILISTIVGQVGKKAKTTASIINAAITTSAEGKVKAELESFSLQLLSEEFQFTAYGFFTLDNHTLHAMLGTIATYCLFIYQSN